MTSVHSSGMQAGQRALGEGAWALHHRAEQPAVDWTCWLPQHHDADELMTGWNKGNHSQACQEVWAAPLFLAHTAFHKLGFSWVRKTQLLVCLQRNSKLRAKGRLSVPSAGHGDSGTRDATQAPFGPIREAASTTPQKLS